jgi:hypothetical protein
MSKLDDDLKEFKKTFTGGFSNFWLTAFNNPFAATMNNYIGQAAHSTALKWFMAGMAVEAIGLWIQSNIMVMDIYPILDFATAGILAVALYMYQRKVVPNV